ncbi:MAG: DUF3971 domain-containing protein, partial [Fischerella sp.]|nr:DUF3971 domain-containing protein [Fischerella sp.]
MSNSPNRDCKFQLLYSNKHLWLPVLTRSGIACSGILLVGLVGGAWRLWNFIHKELTPLAEKSLTNTLNRPVKLGEVRRFSLVGVEFGASAIPATPTDPDRVAVDAVEVGFDPLQLLFRQTLKLDVTLVNPDVYVEQDEQERWITTTIAKPGKAEAIQTDLDKLRFRNAHVVLVPRHKNGGEKEGEWGDGSRQRDASPNFPTSPVKFSSVNGTAQLREKNQVMRMDLTGQSSNSGSISLKGDVRLKTLAANLQIRGQDLVASDVTRLVKLPLALQAGQVSGDLQMQFQLGQTQPPLLFGNVDLQRVQFQVPRLPQPFINSQGTLRFQGREIKLDSVTGSYGKIPLVANGVIDTKTGYKVAGRVNGVNVADVQETLKLKLPVPVTGELKADLKFEGKLTQPILSGVVATSKPARIDKVDFDTASGKFEFSPKDAVI